MSFREYFVKILSYILEQIYVPILETLGIQDDSILSLWRGTLLWPGITLERPDRSTVASQDFALTTCPAEGNSFSHALSKRSCYRVCFIFPELVKRPERVPDYQP